MATIEPPHPKSDARARRRRNRFVVLAVLLAALFIAGYVVWSLLGQASVAVRPSRETTYITGPLHADGSVDYIAAMNRRCRQGVTVDNNAVALLWRALGPERCNPATREEYFHELGIPVPPLEGDYFVSFEDFVDRKHTAEEGRAASGEQILAAKDQRDASQERPWAREEFPIVAEWLDANDKPLALVVEAIHRPRWYDPLVATSAATPYLMIELPMAQNCRSFAQALAARAMLRAAEGRIDEAWQDLMAIHRLSRLVMQGPGAVEGLVGIALDSTACTAERALAQHTKLTSRQNARMRADLDGLAPVCDMVDKIEVGERFTCLASLYSTARSIVDGRPDDWVPSRFRRNNVDWNLVFTRVNEFWDRQVAAGRISPRAARVAALAELADELHARDAARRTVTGFASAMFSRQARSKYIADIFLSLTTPVLVVLHDAQDRAALDLELTRLVFSLAAYRADHGAYPAQLSQLVPHFLDEVPEDVFAAAPIRYRVADGGYTLHSFGANGRDDVAGAKEIGVENPEEDCHDDLFIRARPVAPEPLNRSALHPSAFRLPRFVPSPRRQTAP